ACVNKALSDAEMEVLVLHCIEGFSTGEIAGVVGRSPRAVNSLLHRARKKARERLVELDEQAR
ncbi:MAG: sigma-70 region 4 domain-containing protein, partial [Armatimonadota bacterium]